MKKKIILIIAVIFILLLGIIIYIKLTKQTEQYNSTTKDINMDINTDDGDQKIDWDNYNIKEIADNLTITSGGIYTLTDTINGCVIIDTDDNVKLILDNVTINNTNGPAIYIKQASDVVIELKEETVNTLIDGNTYLDYEEVDGVIYSKSDLTFEGTGVLKITANYLDGIVSKDDLKFISGNYIINSQDDAIRGKDSVYIQNGTFTITAKGDGIKSTNDTDSDKGFIKIEDGTFNITSELDGIQAETKLLIQNGTFNIKTGGGSSNVSTSSNWGNWGRIDSVSQTASAKGLKASNNLVIEDGTFTLDTSDDSIHSNNSIGIENGTFLISSGDDGIHADTELIIDGGTIDISKSYEGIESGKITINSGKISIVSSDDGINIAGGNDASSLNRPGQNSFTNSSKYILTINGGEIYVNANGDGIDINGCGYVYGGEIIVDGPSDSGNSALDYDSTFEVNGGTLLAISTNGMFQGISSNSSQYNVSIYFNSIISSGSTISITDENETEIILHTTIKNSSAIAFSSSQLKKGSTYKVKIDNETYTTFTVNSITTTVGNGHNQINNMPGRR